MIIGVYGLLRVCVSLWFGNPFGQRIGIANGASRFVFSVMIAGFYIVKYGGFALGMGLWVALTPGFLAHGTAGNELNHVLDALGSVGKDVLITAAILFVSHGVSFVLNFLRRGEYRRRNVIVLLFIPYARMFLVLVVLFGAFLTASYLPGLARSTAFALAVVLLKIPADLLAHLLEHREKPPRAADDHAADSTPSTVPGEFVSLG